MVVGLRSWGADHRADSGNPTWGLTNWRGVKVRRQDVANAKNYLSAEELCALNNLVEQYLVFAEGQAMRRISMSMAEWLRKLDGFLTLNREILDNAGQISHDLAKQHAESQFELFHQLRQQKDTASADQNLADLSQLVHSLSNKTQSGP
ncbi:RhuM family protein [Pseudomonas thivervalensis]|uniref:RhuM family protein n=1 Tax=Pseudomonas thivervalensis TaxID=86265 RepID=UPI00209E617D|nr:RhuM family protein [Pseudomonas thivervalensis]